MKELLDYLAGSVPTVVALPSSSAFAEDRPQRAEVSAGAQTDVNRNGKSERSRVVTLLGRLFGPPDTG